jgi:hypothetical protein
MGGRASLSITYFFQADSLKMPKYNHDPDDKTLPTYFFKEVARGGERTRGLSISFIFSFFSTLPLSHSGSPTYIF